MKKIQLKSKKTGKVINEYVPVHSRIMEFRNNEAYKDLIFTTKILEHKVDDGFIMMACEITDQTTGKVVANAHSYEREDAGHINQTSYIENCETGCVGRALGMLGIGIDTSLASFDEVSTAMSRQDDKRPWLTTSLLDKAIDRHSNGEQGLADKVLKAYKVTEGQKRILDNMIQEDQLQPSDEIPEPFMTATEREVYNKKADKPKVEVKPNNTQAIKDLQQQMDDLMGSAEKPEPGPEKKAEPEPDTKPTPTHQTKPERTPQRKSGRDWQPSDELVIREGES